MDPLSITAGILAILGAGGQVGSVLRKIIALEDAPDALLALNNEVSNTGTVVEEVNDLLYRCGDIEEVPRSLVTHLECTKKTALALARFVAYDLTTNEGAKPRLDKSRWFRAASKIQELKAKLQSDKDNLLLSLGLFKSLNSIKDTRQLVGQVQEVDALVRTLTQHLLESPSRLEAFRSEGRESQLKLSSRSLSNQQVWAPSKAHSNSRLNTPKGSEAREGIIVPAQTRSTDASSSVHQAPILVSTKRPNSCGLDCRCTCHQYYHNRSPQCLSRLVGSLFVGYEASPWCAGPCTDPICRARTQRFSYTYAFPRWLLNRVLQLYITYSQSGGPELILRVMRVRDHNDPPFLHLRARWNDPAKSDLGSIKTMIDSGEASVLDVDPRGYTLLHHAVSNFDCELIEYLLKSGSDPFYQAANGNRAYTLAWEYALGSDHASKRSNLSALFDQSRLSLLGFSELHRAYLGLSGVTFDIALESLDRKLVDSTDASSGTTLSWAAERGDETATARLLACGADPNKASIEGWTPLHWAAMVGSCGCVEQLLAAKAHLEFRNSDGDTALCVAAQYDEPKVMKLLIGHGANIHIVDKNGETILENSIYCKQPQSIKALQEVVGPKLLEMFWSRSVVCFAAWYADSDTLHALLSAVEGIVLDPDQMSAVEDALDAARLRKDINERGEDPDPYYPLYDDPTEWFQIFEELANKLMNSLMGEDAESATTDDDDDDDDDGCTDGSGSENQDGDSSDEERVWEDAQET